MYIVCGKEQEGGADRQKKNRGGDKTLEKNHGKYPSAVFALLCKKSVYIHTHKHTQTHTHVYMYMYIYML